MKSLLQILLEQVSETRMEMFCHALLCWHLKKMLCGLKAAINIARQAEILGLALEVQSK